MLYNRPRLKSWPSNNKYKTKEKKNAQTHVYHDVEKLMAHQVEEKCKKVQFMLKKSLGVEILGIMFIPCPPQVHMCRRGSGHRRLLLLVSDIPINTFNSRREKTYHRQVSSQKARTSSPQGRGEDRQPAHGCMGGSIRQSTDHAGCGASS